MNFKEHCKELENEIVGYRAVLEAIKLGASQQRQTALYNLCVRALQEPAGAAVAYEFAMLRAIEALTRQQVEVAFAYIMAQKEDATPTQLMKIEDEAANLDTKVRECLGALDTHRKNELTRRGIQATTKIILPEGAH